MKTHYTAIKIIANSPENVKYSLDDIKERARIGFKARRSWECLAWTQATFNLLPTLLLVIVWNKIKQADFIMSYLQKSVNSPWPPG